MALPDGVTIRRGVPAEAEALAQLHLDVWDDAYTGLMPQEILDERRARSTSGSSGGARSWSGRADLALRERGGPGRIRQHRADPRQRHRIPLQLFALYVRAGYCGTGVGYALFEQAVGDRAASLRVLANNERAISFYERQGFRLDGRLEEHDEGQHARMVRAGTPAS